MKELLESLDDEKAFSAIVGGRQVNTVLSLISRPAGTCPAL